MNHNHYDKTDCPSYAGDGKCKFQSSKKCSYNKGNFVCSVCGDLSGKPCSKTQLETEESMMTGSARFGREVMV